MYSPTVAHILIAIVASLSILFMLIRPKGIPEVYWVGAGVVALLLLRLISLRLAAGAVVQGLDVYLFLTGMMLLSELARESGVFEWLASAAVSRAGGSCVRLFTLVYGIGTLVTIFLSNDATAVVLTPTILSAVRKAEVRPLPYLFTCAIVANAASFLLPISNPANLVVYPGETMLPLGQWLVAFGLPSVLSIAATYVGLRFFFRRELGGNIRAEVAYKPLRSEGRLTVAGLAVVVVVLLIASASKHSLGLPVCLAALAVTAVISIKTQANAFKLVRHISWSTLVLVAGLLILVSACESAGALSATQGWLRDVMHWPVGFSVMIVGVSVAVANNLVNNLPLGLVAGATLQAVHTRGVLAHAVLVGIDLGPNLSITGSLATILWLLALRKEKLDVGFWQFFKVGAVVMPTALMLALGVAICMQTLLPLPK